jgi:hypothetical protein
MEPKKAVSKVLAFVPAILLVGGLVAYRAGTFQPRSSVEPQPAPVVLTPPPDSQPAGDDPKNPAIMYGSKWAPPIHPGEHGLTFSKGEPVTPPTTPAPNPPITQVNPAFLGGSKSIIILEPSKGMPQPVPPPMPEPRKP